MRLASILQRFTRYGMISGDPRTDYRAVHGTDAPPFNASLPPKLWEDPSAPDSAMGVSYNVLPILGQELRFQSLVIEGSMARRVNLPGLPHYPPYNAGLSFSTIANPGQQLQSLNAELLSTPQQAAQMNSSAEIGGERIEYEVFGEGGGAITYGPSEPRRVWVVVKGTARLIVGLLLKDKATVGLTSTDNSSGFNLAVGVGSPGHWDLSTPQPKWIPDRIDLGHISNNLPEVPVPVNDMAFTESLVWSGSFGTTLFVQTADEANPNKPGVGIGGVPEHFAADFAESIERDKRVESKLDQLLAGLKASGLMR